jgi:superfamily II DNA or RNA helicase
MGLTRPTGRNTDNDTSLSIRSNAVPGGQHKKKDVKKQKLTEHERKKKKYDFDVPKDIKRSGTIKINREYNVLRIPPMDMEVTSCVLRLLSFRLMYFDNSQQSMDFETVDCYAVIDIGGKPFIICAAGILTELKSLLKKIGYKVIVRDVTKYPANIEKRLRINEKVFANTLGNPRDWQLECLEMIQKFRCGQFHVSTGAGKTTFITAVIKAAQNARILYATKGRQALMTAYNAAVEAGVIGAQIYKSNHNVRNSRVVYCTTGKLENLILKGETFDIVFIDEQHETCTEFQISKIIPLRTAKIFAFSAQWRDRSDNADRWSDIVYGPLRFSKAYVSNVKDGNIVDAKIIWRDTSHIRIKGLDGLTNYEFLKEAICLNQKRNELIAEDALRHADSQVLIMVSKTIHALALKKLLPHAILAHLPLNPAQVELFTDLDLLPKGYPLIHGSTDILRSYRDLFSVGAIKLAIATSIWYQAVDFRQCEVVIRAEAQQTKIKTDQIIGRGSRICEAIDKKEMLVYEYNDVFNNRTSRWAARRQKLYEEHGFSQLSFQDWLEQQNVEYAKTKLKRRRGAK